MRTWVLDCALMVTFLGFGCLGGLGEEQKMTNTNTTGRIVGTLPLSTSRPRISLDGEWALRYDPGHDLAHTKGMEEKWYQRDVKFPDVTQVPGCWHYKTGKPCDSYGSVVWFKKTFQIPATWNKGRVWLQVGGGQAVGGYLAERRARGFHCQFPVADQDGHQRLGQVRGGEHTGALRELYGCPDGRRVG